MVRYMVQMELEIHTAPNNAVRKPGTGQPRIMAVASCGSRYWGCQHGDTEDQAIDALCRALGVNRSSLMEIPNGDG